MAVDTWEDTNFSIPAPDVKYTIFLLETTMPIQPKILLGLESHTLRVDFVFDGGYWIHP